MAYTFNSICEITTMFTTDFCFVQFVHLWWQPKNLPSYSLLWTTGGPIIFLYCN